MLDWVVWLFTFTLLLMFLIWVLKGLVDYPGLMNWKCVYDESSPDRLEIDLSEYELAAIEIPDRKRKDVEKEKKKTKIEVTDFSCHASDLASDIHSVVTSVGASEGASEASEESARSAELKYNQEKLFQDKIIVINEHVGRQC